MILDHYCQNCISGKEIGHWAAFPSNFEIFIVFSIFFQIINLNSLVIREAYPIQIFLVVIKFHLICGKSNLY